MIHKTVFRGRMSSFAGYGFLLLSGSCRMPQVRCIFHAVRCIFRGVSSIDNSLVPCYDKIYKNDC